MKITINCVSPTSTTAQFSCLSPTSTALRVSNVNCVSNACRQRQLCVNCVSPTSIVVNCVSPTSTAGQFSCLSPTSNCVSPTSTAAKFSSSKRLNVQVELKKKIFNCCHLIGALLRGRGGVRGPKPRARPRACRGAQQRTQP